MGLATIWLTQNGIWNKKDRFVGLDWTGLLVGAILLWVSCFFTGLRNRFGLVGWHAGPPSLDASWLDGWSCTSLLVLVMAELSLSWLFSLLHELHVMLDTQRVSDQRNCILSLIHRGYIYTRFDGRKKESKCLEYSPSSLSVDINHTQLSIKIINPNPI